MHVVLVAGHREDDARVRIEGAAAFTATIVTVRGAISSARDGATAFATTVATGGGAIRDTGGTAIPAASSGSDASGGAKAAGAFAATVATDRGAISDARSPPSLGRVTPIGTESTRRAASPWLRRDVAASPARASAGPSAASTDSSSAE